MKPQENVKKESGVLELPVSRAMAPQEISRSVIDAAAREASRVLFEMLDMGYDEAIASQFLTSKDGQRLLSTVARMLSFINEKNIEKLEKGLW